MADISRAESYVSGKLSEEESAGFEAEMIRRPELAADVDVRQRIKLGLALLEERQQLAPLLEASPARRPWLGMAAAALLVLVAAGSWYLWLGKPVRPALFAASGTEPATLVLPLIRSRSDEVTRVAITSDVVGLRALVAGEAGTHYEVRLLAESGEVLAELREARVGQDGYVHLLLAPAGLQPGRARLELTPGEGEAEAFALEFLPSH